MIVKRGKGAFLCVGELPTEADPAPLEFVIGDGSLSRVVQKAALPRRSVVTSGIVNAANSNAARNEAVQKGGNTRYA